MFEGIVTGGNYKQTNDKASVSWQLKSHWGDFEQNKGRFTSAAFHQALNQNDVPQKASTLKPAYAEDYGFAHSEISLNVIAQYNDVEMQLKEKKKKKWTGTKYKYKEVEVDVTRETDIRFDLQARKIPVIYGVVRTKPIPVFADIGASTDTNNQVFAAHALCEGPIQSVMNIYVEDQPLVCIDAADSAARASGSEAVDIKCVGRTDSGNVLGGSSATSSTALSYVKDLSNQEVADLGVNGSNSEVAAVQARIKSAQANSRRVDMFENPAGNSFSQSNKGIVHEKVMRLSDPMPWVLEFHGGYEDQRASSMISTQANTAGKKFRIQQDYWTSGNSGVEYWGPQHQLLDTAYLAIKFELEADQTTVPSLEYVVRGKMLDCFNYDGSYEHNSLSTYTSEDITDFAEGDTVTIKTRRAFTASSDAGGATYSANDTIAASKTILDIFYFTDGKGDVHWRMRWDLTGTEQDRLNEAKDFYVVKGSDNWSMITYDGVANFDSDFTIAEVLTVTVSSPTSSGTANYQANTSNPSTSFDDAADNESLYRFSDFEGESGPDDHNMYGSDAYAQSQSLNATYNESAGTIVFTDTTSTNTPNSTTVEITNKLKLSSNASSTSGFYTGCQIEVTKVLPNGDRISGRRKIIGYQGSTRIVTLSEEFLDFHPDVGDEVKIHFTKDMANTQARGADLRPSTNFAMILLDYISSKTYGPGVSLATSIDLDTFRLAAQMCDTQSDITVNFASSVSLTAGDVYRYYEDSLEKWRGTVKTTGSGTSHTFTDCYGKLTNKFNDWAHRNLGDLVYEGTNLNVITNAGTQTSVANKASAVSAPVIRKVSGSGPSTATMTGNGSGNPISSYSLYDSDDVKFWKYLGWEEQRQKYVTRHQGNIKLDTNQTVFEIIRGLLDHFNGQLSFVDGKYRLTVESTRTSDEFDAVFKDDVGGNSPTVADLDIRARYITDEDIIGNIQIKDEGLSKSFNSLSASIQDPQINFDSRSVSFFNSSYLKEDRGVVRSTNFTAPGITNYFNARMLVKQTLDKSRFNRQISFTMRPVGLSILPGELIRIEYDRFGWDSSSPKMFRVETVAIKLDCTIAITATEYDDRMYLIDPPRRSPFYIDTKQAAVARVPSAPTNVSVSTSGDAGANVVSWTASTGLGDTGRYEVWRASSKSGNPSTSVVSHATKLDFSPETNSYTDIGFTNTSNQTYYYWVRAYNELTLQTTSGTTTSRKKYYSAFNANSNYGDQTDAAATGRAVEDGVSPISVDIKSSSVLVQCDSAGNVILTSGNIPDSGNEFRVYEGTTQLQFDGAGTSNGTFNVSISATNVTAGSIVDSGAYATINPATGMSQNIGTLVFTISGKTGAGTSFTASRTQSFTKAIPGEVGVGVELAPSKYVINYTKAGSESDSIVFTATPRNMANLTPQYEFKVANTVRQSYSTTATYTLADNLEPASGASTLVVVSVKDGGSGDVLAADSVSIYGVQDGSDAVTGFLTNPSETIPAETDGTLASGALDNAGGTFKVFIGGTDRTTHADVTFAASSASNMSSAINSTTGVYTVSALTGDAASIQFTATVAANSSLLGGTGASAVTIGPVPYSMSKAKRGTQGPQGNSITGATGPRTTTLRLYYSSSSASAPTAPTSSNTNTFVFNTGTFSTILSNWQHNTPTFASGNANKYWYIPATVTEASYGGTQTITFGTVTQAIGFSGLVTFSAANTAGDGTNSLSFGATGTTEIHGNKITTGSIVSTNHSGTGDGSGFSSAGTKFNLNDGTISAKQFRINSSGDANFKGTMTIGSTNLDATNTLNENTTKAQVGLGSVDNTSDSSVLGTAATNANNANKTAGEVGGWTIDSSAIFSGTKDTSGFTSSNGHITLTSAGGIHTPMFYVDTNGNAGFKGTVTIGSTDLDANNTLNENTTKANVGLGNVDNDSTDTIRSGTTKANVGLGNVDNTSDSTVLGSAASNANSAAKNAGTVGGWTIDSGAIFSGTKDTSGYTAGGITFNSGGSIHAKEFYIDTSGNANFKGTVTIGSTDLDANNTLNENTTKANVGLGNVDNDSTDTIRSGTTKANVGLGNVDNTSDADHLVATNQQAKTTGSVGGWALTAGQIYTDINNNNWTGTYTASGMVLKSDGTIYTPAMYSTSSTVYFKGIVTDTATIGGRTASTVISDANKAKWAITGTSSSYRAPIYTGTGGSGTTTPNSGESITVTATDGTTTNEWEVEFSVTTSSGQVATSITDTDNAFTESNFGSFTSSTSNPTRTGTVTHTVSGLKFKISYGSMSVTSGNVSCCFIEGTSITMEDGSEKDIEFIEIGDKVKTEKGSSKVVQLHPTILGNRKLYSINKSKPFVTAEHPFRTKEGWKSFSPEATKEENEDLFQELSGELNLRDQLLWVDGTYKTLESTERKEDNFNTPLYNFSVEGDDHSYFANGYCVHNK